MTPAERVATLFAGGYLSPSERPFREDLVAMVEAAVAEEREACARVVEEMASLYPADVFPDPPPGQHGTTIDACSARALRRMLPVAAADIRARRQS